MRDIDELNDLPSFDHGNTRQEGGTHYKSLPIEPWDYILANEIPFMEGSVIKYLTRWRDKGGMVDLLKAKHFIEKLIEHENIKTATSEGIYDALRFVPGSSPIFDKTRSTKEPP